MANQPTQLRLKIDRKPEEDNDEHIEQMTLQLVSELNEIDVNRVDLAKEKAPPNTRGEGVIIEIVLSLLASGGVATSLINFLQSWSKRNEGRSVEVTTESGKTWTINGYSYKEAKQLVESLKNSEHK